MEGFIKNHKTFLHSDRTSFHTFEANHFRLFLHSAAYVLLQTLAEIGLRGTTWTNAQYNMLQNRILKVAGRVCEIKTKITFHLPAAFPTQTPLWQDPLQSGNVRSITHRPVASAVTSCSDTTKAQGDVCAFDRGIKVNLTHRPDRFTSRCH